MKIIIYTFFIVLTFILKVNGQVQDGKYFEESDFLIFSSDSIHFKIESNGGLTTDLFASGKYNNTK